MSGMSKITFKDRGLLLKRVSSVAARSWVELLRRYEGRGPSQQAQPAGYPPLKTSEAGFEWATEGQEAMRHVMRDSHTSRPKKPTNVTAAGRA